MGSSAGRTSKPVQRKIPIHPLLNFQFLKTLPVPKFSILITQIFGITNFHLLSPFLEFTEYYILVFD